MNNIYNTQPHKPSQDQIDNVTRSLRELAGDPGRCALLVIDVQFQYCGPDMLYNFDRHIPGSIASIAPLFRDAGAKLCAVYMADTLNAGSRPFEDSDDIFYEFQPDVRRDHIVPKIGGSPFRDGYIDDVLRKNSITHILACGFNLSACVRDTVEDGLAAGYDTTLLQDLTGNNRYYPHDTDSVLEAYDKRVRIAHTEDFTAPQSRLSLIQLPDGP